MEFDIATRAARAKQILEDELFVEAFETLERNLVDSIANDPGAASVTTLAARIAGLRDVRQHLRSIMLNGEDIAASEERRRTVV